MSRGRRSSRLLCAVVASVAVASGGCTLQTAGAPRGRLHLTATFDDVQHLVTGHAVKAADVQVGTVTKVALHGYRAKVTFSIVDGRKVPVGTSAVVAQTSLLGENYVQLRFPDHFDPVRGPFLADNAEITTTHVDPSLEHVAEQGIEVLAAIQGGDLAAIVNTGATGLGDKGPELNQLVRQLADIGRTFAGQRDDLGRVVDSLGTLGGQLAAHPDDLGTLLDNLATATRTLSTQRDRVIGAVRGLTELARALNENVLDPHTRQLRTLLIQLDPIAAALAADRGTVGDLLAGLATLAQRAPHAFNSAKDILLYGWYDSLRLNNGTIVPFPTGATAVRSLLSPPS